MTISNIAKWNTILGLKLKTQLSKLQQKFINNRHTHVCISTREIRFVEIHSSSHRLHDSSLKRACATYIEK
jgi:hypothetical protein